MAFEYDFMASQQPVFISLLMLAVCLAAAAILTAGPMVWYRAYRRWSRQEAVLQHEPRRLASWGFIDLIVGFLLLIFVSIVLMVAAQHFRRPSPERCETRRAWRAATTLRDVSGWAIADSRLWWNRFFHSGLHAVFAARSGLFIPAFHGRCATWRCCLSRWRFPPT